MSIKRASRALNAAGQARELRASYQSCSSSIVELNTKLKIVRIATMRSIVAMRAMRSNEVLRYIQISIRARTSSLK